VKPKQDWLKEMMSAALSDSPESMKDPDFQAVRAAYYESSRFQHRGFLSHRRNSRSRVFITAAAAVLAVSIAIPAGIITGKRISTRNLILEQNTLFVEELIGGTLFDEGISTGNSDNWIFSSEMDKGFFDT